MAGRGPEAEEATAVAKIEAKETWYPTAPESEQWLLGKCSKIWQG